MAPRLRERRLWPSRIVCGIQMSKEWARNPLSLSSTFVILALHAQLGTFSDEPHPASVESVSAVSMLLIQSLSLPRPSEVLRQARCCPLVAAAVTELFQKGRRQTYTGILKIGTVEEKI